MSGEKSAGHAAFLKGWFERDKEAQRQSRLRHQARAEWMENDYVPPRDLLKLRREEIKQPVLRGV